jgi:16S rRNA (guanine527-N7)-methyltransferase
VRPPQASPHQPALARLGLAEPARAALARYLDLLAAWSARVNLTGARTPAERVRVLVEPVLPLAALLEPGAVLDIGSGNGSPGLVLAALRPVGPLTLLEPRQRRWAFLREAARAMGVAEPLVLRLRYQDYAGPPARNVLVRGLRLEPAALAGLVEEGGQLLLGGPRPAGSGAAPLAWAGRVGSAPFAFQLYRRAVPRGT